MSSDSNVIWGNGVQSVETGVLYWKLSLYSILDTPTLNFFLFACQPKLYCFDNKKGYYFVDLVLVRGCDGVAACQLS